jgi:uncharacterized protein (TIGR02996 family)
MIHSDADAFLASIWTSDELGPWLIFADYLDEQGLTDHAELLRLSCEYAQLCQHDLAQAVAVGRQRQQLLDRLDPANEAPEVWLARHWDLKRDLHRHLQRPGVTVDLTNLRLGNAGAWALAACPLLLNARQLRLSYAGIRADGMQRLAGSRHLLSLQELDVSWNLITDAGVAALAASPYLRQLTRLNLAYCYLIGSAGYALADSPLAQQLIWLDVTYNTWPDDERLLVRERYGRRVQGLFPVRVR